MISFETAKALKKLGFPQKTHGKGDWSHQATEEGRLYHPTLEELIVACDREFSGLDRWGQRWTASSNREDGIDPETGDSFVLQADADSPAEAVALLFLALKGAE